MIFRRPQTKKTKGEKTFSIFFLLMLESEAIKSLIPLLLIWASGCKDPLVYIGIIPALHKMKTLCLKNTHTQTICVSLSYSYCVTLSCFN